MNILSSMLNFLLNKIDNIEQTIYDGLNIESEFKRLNLEINHPVGSYYITDNAEHNPATMFGGTWSKVQGRFLVGAGDNGKADDEALNLTLGAIGGESKHRLTGQESGIASHNHTFGNNFIIGMSGSNWGWNAGDNISGTKYQFIYNNNRATINSTASKDDTDASLSHNNLPPYKAVNIWVRTA